MDKQRLSVAMCTYNGAQYIHEQLTSIAAQTRLPDEVIICDDASTDATLALLKKWVKLVKFPVKIKHNTKRLGITKNFEQAISLCRGELIALSDQDNVWRDDKLQIQEQALAEHPDAGFAFSDRIVIDERGKIIHSSFWKQIGLKKKHAIFSKSCADQLKSGVRYGGIGGCTMVFRTSLIPQILPIPELFSHDLWIVLICSMMGMHGVTISEPLIYYRRYPAQYTRRAELGPFYKRGLIYLKWILKSLLGESEEAYDNPYLRRWDIAYSLINEKIASYQDQSAFQVLKEIVNHYAFRNRLYHQSRLTRPASIITELISGRYHFYSLGLKSAIKDLVIKPCFNEYEQHNLDRINKNN